MTMSTYTPTVGEHMSERVCTGTHADHTQVCVFVCVAVLLCWYKGEGYSKSILHVT